MLNYNNFHITNMGGCVPERNFRYTTGEPRTNTQKYEIGNSAIKINVK